MNGRSSEVLPVKFGVLQGSVIGPTLFSLFRNDLPDLIVDDDDDAEIHMHADISSIKQALLEV